MNCMGPKPVHLNRLKYKLMTSGMEMAKSMTAIPGITSIAMDFLSPK
jgi:hypothetical protein